MNVKSAKGLVSVIIPCFNHGAYIDDTIGSVLEQTYKNFEIIIIDAGSDDLFTREKLKSYARPQTKILFSRQRLFPSQARNLGFQKARGEFILTLDADDLIEQTFIEKALVRINSDRTIGAVSSKVMYFGYEEGFLEYRGGLLEDVLISMGSLLCALIRREAWEDINGFDEDFIDGFEDWEFWIRLTKNNWSISILPEILFYYRQKESSRVTEVFAKQNLLKEKIRQKHKDIYEHPFNYLKESLKKLS